MTVGSTKDSGESREHSQIITNNDFSQQCSSALVEYSTESIQGGGFCQAGLIEKQ